MSRISAATLASAGSTALEANGRPGGHLAQHQAPVQLQGWLPTLARVLLLAAVPASLVWLPFSEVPGFGNITLLDVILLSLWACTLGAFVTAARRGIPVRRALTIAALASLPALLAAFATQVSPFGGEPLVEVSMHTKKFGGAAILPLAMACFGSPGFVRAIPRMFAICIAAMALFVAFPELRMLLPTGQAQELPVRQIRAAGLTQNVNDLAYLSVGLFVGYVASMRLFRSKLRMLPTLVLVAGISYCIVSSGSRSGIMGGLLGLAYFVSAGQTKLRTRVGLIAAIAVAGLIGFQASDVFQERVTAAVTQQGNEANVSGRVAAQLVVLETSIVYPLGVGYRAMSDAARATSPSGYIFDGTATSDNVYLDTLLATGIVGLALLLLVMGHLWRYVRAPPRVARLPDRVLRAGLLAFLVFGLASVTPGSATTSILFFFLAGIASLYRFHFIVSPGPGKAST